MLDPLALTDDQFRDAFRRLYARGDFHAGALYRAFFKLSHLDVRHLPAFADAPELASRVQHKMEEVQLPRIVEQIAEAGTVKLVLELADGLRVESVMIPMPGYTTVCVSSQAGCRMGCRFCRTGRIGLLRQLSAAEIVGQVHCARVRLGYPVRNVVFMGMGEPLDNFEAVVQAIRVLNAQRGLNIARRHITVSTAGLAEGIRRLASEFAQPINLALSLNAVDDDLRERLMPINRRYPLGELKSTLEAYPLVKGGVIFVEYVLIRGLNDSPAHAVALTHFLNGLRVKLNLIAYNPDEQSQWQAPEEETIRRFKAVIAEKGIFVRRRTDRGTCIQAACGQLGGAAAPATRARRP